MSAVSSLSRAWGRVPCTPDCKHTELAALTSPGGGEEQHLSYHLLRQSHQRYSLKRQDGQVEASRQGRETLYLSALCCSGHTASDNQVSLLRAQLSMTPYPGYHAVHVVVLLFQTERFIIQQLSRFWETRLLKTTKLREIQQVKQAWWHWGGRKSPCSVLIRMCLICTVFNLHNPQLGKHRLDEGNSAWGP